MTSISARCASVAWVCVAIHGEWQIRSETTARRLCVFGTTDAGLSEDTLLSGSLGQGSLSQIFETL